jgi:hypothetical protein
VSCTALPGVSRALHSLTMAGQSGLVGNPKSQPIRSSPFDFDGDDCTQTPQPAATPTPEAVATAKGGRRVAGRGRESQLLKSSIGGTLVRTFEGALTSEIVLFTD